MAKRGGVENQFCVVPRKSIKLLGESVGINYLSSEVAATIAEDASYRIRQSIQSASLFFKHSKRDHMTGDDTNRALFWSHVEPIYGYGSKNSNIFSSISTKDGDIFFHEDKEINLRELAFSKGFSSLSDLGSCEISVEVSVLDKTSASKSESQGETEPSSTKPPEFDSLTPVSKSYFNQVTRNIITADIETVKVILDDLKTNSRIQILLPYLVNFITTAIQTLSEDNSKLLRIFELVKALVDNKNLYLEPYVVQIVRAVMFCLIEKPGSKMCTSWLDDWCLRQKSAQTLWNVDRKCNNAGNFLHLQLLRTFKDIFHASDRPLHCKYGAITGLTVLGPDAIEQTIFPHFKEFSDILMTLRDSHPEQLMEIFHILDILKMSTISVFRNKLKTIAMIREKQEHLQKSRGVAQKSSTNAADNTHRSSMVESRQSNKHLPEWYKQTYDVIGDSLVLFLGNCEDYENFTQSKVAPVAQPRNSMLNQSRLQYVRKMIKNAVDSREQKASPSLTFSLQGEKARCMGEKYQAFSNVNFFDTENSELRFQNLLENSLRPKQSFNFRFRVMKLACLNAKRTSLRKTTALLSLPF